MSNKICPSCGKKLKRKTFKVGGVYKRGFYSFICVPCGYGEYDENEKEQMINDGLFDNEL